MINTMKKVTVFWDEVQSYSAEINVPDNLTKEEESDYVTANINHRRQFNSDVIEESIQIENE